jgi:pSer/pThr/pTyr-binding forkhead associated (FHA) protein
MDLCLEVERSGVDTSVDTVDASVDTSVETLADPSPADTADPTDAAQTRTFSYYFTQQEVVIGRSEAADVRLPDEAVSLVHARLVREEQGTWAVVDCGSANSTLLDGRQLKAGQLTPLTIGARLRVASFVLRVVPPVATGQAITPRRTAELARAMVQEAFSALDAGLPELELLSGPLRGDRLRLEGEESSLGRGEECTFCLPDGDASRRHALLRRDDAGVIAIDLGSKNGLFVQGQRISSELRLRHGDELRLGRTRLRYHDPAEALLLSLGCEQEPPGASAAADEPSVSEPSVSEPSVSESSESSVSESSVSESSVSESSVSEPSVSEPSVSEPSVSEPSVSESSVSEPSVSEPSVSEPSLSVSASLAAASAQSCPAEPASSAGGATRRELWIVLVLGGVLVAGAVGLVLYLLG